MKNQLYEKLNIAILGFGTVGKGVYEIIKKQDTDKTKKINIVKILVRDKNKEGYEDNIYTDDISAITDDTSIDLVVECMGGVDPAYDYVISCLEKGKLVVTSNKMLLATKYDELVKKYKDQIKYEATVCGGIHIFHAIEEIKNVDRIISFRGIVNGTTNYILSEMTKKVIHENNTSDDLFDIVLKEAQDLGFAEKDPTNDIDGYDAMYKGILLYNEIYDKKIKVSDAIVSGIRDISCRDIIEADREGKVIKLILEGDEKGIKVAASSVSKDDYLSKIDSNLNCISIVSDNLGISSYIAAGAGKFPTAHAVVLDICDYITL